MHTLIFSIFYFSNLKSPQFANMRVFKCKNKNLETFENLLIFQSFPIDWKNLLRFQNLKKNNRPYLKIRKFEPKKIKKMQLLW